MRHPTARAAEAAVLLAGLACAGARGAAAQVVRGTVVDVTTGRPVPGAMASLVNGEGEVVATATGDGAGAFRVRAPGPAALYLYVEALGYLAMVEGPLTLSATAPVEVEFALEPVPLEVEGVEVVAERRVQVLDRVGFYDRLRMGLGHQWDRTALERRGSPHLVSDWLRGVPGASVDNEGMLHLRGMSSMTGSCPYRVFLDGVLVVTDPFGADANWVRDLIRPEDVGALEVYTRPSEVPIQYGGAQAGCGVVLIWTRR